MNKITLNLQIAMLTKLVNYISGAPEKRLANVWGLLRKFPLYNKNKQLIDKFFVLKDPNNNYHQLTVRALKSTTPSVMVKTVVNGLIYATAYGLPMQNAIADKVGYKVPWAILLDPTESCNLHCRGCWANDYRKTRQLDYATLDRIISEANQIGIYFIVMSGGEPFTRFGDLYNLARKYNNTLFHVFTNGTLINKNVAEKMKEVGNITMAISLEGFRESTDARRGAGTFDKIMAAMDLLKDAGIFFGASTTYHRDNIAEVSSDEYINLLIEKGCFTGWYFTYVPVGADSDLGLMATPEQRAYMYKRINEIRKKKPIFLIDFWNDGEYIDGCIAGGRCYIHINANGDMEPCAFIHYANMNINNTSLLKGLGSPIFRSYQRRQPFNKNHLCPCPLIDNPQILNEIVCEAKAHSTQLSKCDPALLAEKLADYAKAWQKKAGEIGEEKGEK